jgi:transcription elongation GreA/GreB family factor
MHLKKQTVIQAIIAKLVEELKLYLNAADASRAEATHESSKAENKYDTRGLEASYLARGQSRQIAELQSAIAEFKKLDGNAAGSEQPVDVGSLVELSDGKEESFYFIGPRAGGTEVMVGRCEVLVITPQSPLGSQLIGRKEGEAITLTLPGSRQKFRVSRVS